MEAFQIVHAHICIKANSLLHVEQAVHYWYKKTTGSAGGYDLYFSTRY